MSDDLYSKAVEIVKDHKYASIVLLQRKLFIGYTRAGRLLETLEANKVIEPYNGSPYQNLLDGGTNDQTKR